MNIHIGKQCKVSWILLTYLIWYAIYFYEQHENKSYAKTDHSENQIFQSCSMMEVTHSNLLMWNYLAWAEHKKLITAANINRLRVDI